MHYIRDRKVPSNILKLFSDTTSIHSYNTRSSLANKFYIKKSRLEIQKRAFSRVGAKILHEMPASLRELYKKPFQTKFHSFLLDILKKHDNYIDISQITSAQKRTIELEFFIQKYLVRVSELVIYVNVLTS